jgi:hypothetical protein
MGILSPNNEVLKQAEAHFNNAKQHPDYCVQSLVHLLRNSQATEVCVLIVSYYSCTSISHTTMHSR